MKSGKIFIGRILNYRIPLFFFLLIFSFCPGGGEIKPVSLTCEHRIGPSVVEGETPRLSWVNEALPTGIKGERQSAYSLAVASSRENLRKGKFDVWDSGKVLSADSYLVPYGGPELKSGQDYWWMVKVWNDRDIASQWSEVARGGELLRPEDWKAKWIGAPCQGEEPQRVIGPTTKDDPSYPAPLFRKTFMLGKEIASAKAFVTGLGYFEFYVNGKKAGEDVLVPNFTNYTVRNNLKYGFLGIDGKSRDYWVLYLAYDITSLLRKGENAAGTVLGNGFYDCTSFHTISFGLPRFICQMEITYKDGTKEIVATDESWKAKESVIVMNDVYGGEVYDANRETAGWCTINCDDSAWAQAVLRTAPTGKLTAHTAPTDRVTERLRTLSFVKRKDGSYEVDLKDGLIIFNAIKQNLKESLLCLKLILKVLF